MDGTKITRERKGRMELYGRHENNLPKDGELNDRHENNSPKYGGPQVSRQNIKEASQQKLSRQKFVKATQKFVNNAAKIYESHGKSL